MRPAGPGGKGINSSARWQTFGVKLEAHGLVAGGVQRWCAASWSAMAANGPFDDWVLHVAQAYGIASE